MLSAGMLLDYLGQPQAAERVRAAVYAALQAGYLTPDLGGTSTTAEVGDFILNQITNG